MRSQEIAVISAVRHRNIVGYVGSVTEQPNLCVVMEYMEAGSLNSMIHGSTRMDLPLPRLLQIAMDVAQGCHYLHRQKPMIIHRDLKSQNILLTRGGVAKIADFGLSRFFQQDVASMTGQVARRLGRSLPHLQAAARQAVQSSRTAGARSLTRTPLHAWPGGHAGMDGARGLQAPLVQPQGRRLLFRCRARRVPLVREAVRGHGRDADRLRHRLSQ